MSYLGKHELSEKGRVGMIAVLTLGTMTATAAALEYLGLSWVWIWIHRQSGVFGLLAAMALWGGAMLAITHGARAAAFAGRLALSGARVGARLGMRLGAVLVFAALRGALEVLRLLPVFVFGPSYALILLRWQVSWQQGLERTALLRQRARQEWTLWRAYRREFRGQFASYRAFRRHFAAGAKAEDSRCGPRAQSRPAPDPFAAACKLMGLPEDGRFTEEQFRARYRALIKELHPDRGGNNEQAAQVNAACDADQVEKGMVMSDKNLPANVSNRAIAAARDEELTQRLAEMRTDVAMAERRTITYVCAKTGGRFFARFARDTPKGKFTIQAIEKGTPEQSGGLLGGLFRKPAPAAQAYAAKEFDRTGWHCPDCEAKGGSIYWNAARMSAPAAREGRRTAKSCSSATMAAALSNSSTRKAYPDRPAKAGDRRQFTATANEAPASSTTSSISGGWFGTVCATSRTRIPASVCHGRTRKAR